MKYLFLLITSSIFFSCSTNDNKQKELSLKEKELELKQKELDLREREMNKDSATYSNNDDASTTPISNLTTEEMVVEIRNEFTRINSLRPTTKRYKFECDAEGTADYYWENNQLVKITIDWGFLGDYSNKSEYYYKDGKLIFSYEVSVGGPAGGNVETTEYRTYVQNDRTIKAMENKKTMPCHICSFNQFSKEYKFANATTTKAVIAAACD